MEIQILVKNEDGSFTKYNDGNPARMKQRMMEIQAACVRNPSIRIVEIWSDEIILATKLWKTGQMK